MMGFTLLEKFGLFSVTVLGVRVLRSIFHVFYDHYLAQKVFCKTVKLAEMGEWGVVTGATAGVGKAYATKLAEMGINVVLISRDRAKLESTSASLEAQYNITTRIVVADFTDNSTKAYHEIEKHMYGLEIGILINNVGMSYPHPEYFLDLPHKDRIYSEIIKCNVYSVTNMCAMLMPQMVQRGKGVVINVASTTATIPSPLLTVYAASKAYIECFSRNLDHEYECSGITIQCLLPGYIATQMSQIKRATFLAPSPEQYVEGAIQLIGIQKVGTGYIPHSIFASIIHCAESVSPSYTAWLIRRTMEDLRARCLRKYIG